MQVTPEIAGQHYAEHTEKPFFGELVDFITSGPVFAMVWQGEGVVDTARNMMGKQDHMKQLLEQFVEISV